MSSDDGLRKYVSVGEPVAILFEDAGVRVFNKPPNLHLLSTVGLLRGLERVGVIPSADAIIHEMTHPSKADRRPADTRVFTDLPDGVDDPAAIGSTWWLIVVVTNPRSPEIRHGKGQRSSVTSTKDRAPAVTTNWCSIPAETTVW